MLRALARIVVFLVLMTPAVRAADLPPAAVTDVEVVAEREAPQICVTFNGRLDRTGLVSYRAYLAVSPAESTSITARDRTLCVEGLKHDRAYTVTLKRGLPLADGRTMTEEEIGLTIPNRAPNLAFKGAGYVLSRLGDEGLTLRSTNVERVHLQVLRMDDPALVEKVYFGRVSRQLSEGEVSELVEHSAQEVWRGDMALADTRNQAVQTPFPLDAVLGTLDPGVYIAAAEATTPNGPLRVTQWFVVSDLGLNSVAGADGLLVFARRVKAEVPAAGVELRLLSAAGVEIAKAATDGNGLARIPADVLKGTGDARPQAVFARAETHFALLDLSNRTAENAEPGPLLPSADLVTAHLFTTRGVYRPGESVDVTALLRDTAGNAVTGGSLVFELKRPDGLTVQKMSAADAGAAAYTVRIPLSRMAQSGRWSVLAHREAEGPVVGEASFAVDDIVPPRFGIALTGDRPVIGRDGLLSVAIAADRVAGAPASFLPGELSVTLRPAATPFPKLSDYRFGLAQETLEPHRKDLPGFTTDWSGRAKADIALGTLPETSRALEAVVQAALVDLGGRRVEREMVLPLAPPPLSIGIRPKFAVDSLPEGATAGFEVVAVDGTGNPVDHAGLSYELIEEEANYAWFEANGRWDYKVEVHDRRVTGGTLDARAAAPALVEEPVGAGRYRLDVFDRATGAASSVRFASGWWLSPTEPAKPDTVDVAVMLPSYHGGETAQVFVQPPYRSLVLVTVADRRVRTALAREIGPEGAFLDIPVDSSWVGGVNVIATAYAKPDPQHNGATRRAVGQAWLPVAPAGRTLDVKVAVPEKASASSTVSADVSVAGAAEGTPVFLTLSAVDDAVQRATGFLPFDPVAALFGAREPGVEVRDLQGRLVPAAESAPDGAATAPLRMLPVGTAPSRRTPIATLFSGVRVAGPDGKVSVPLTLPENGARLRLTAIAWTPTQVGRGEAWLKVAEPIAADITAPVSLVEGDAGEVTLSLLGQTAEAQTYTIAARAEGSVTVGEVSAKSLQLMPQQRSAVRVPVSTRDTGFGRVIFDVTGPDGVMVSRAASLSVSASTRVKSRTQTATLTRDGGPVKPADDLLAGLRPETVRVVLSAGAPAGLGVPALLADLRDAAAPGAAAAAARLLELVSMGEAASSVGLGSREALDSARRLALDTLLASQRPDGAFAPFSPKGDADGWLSAFAVDVLDRARAAGVAVPEPSLRAAVAALRQSLDNTWVAPGDLPARAYALLVLARMKTVDPDAVKHFRETYWEALPTDLARLQVAVALVLLGEEPKQDVYSKLSGVRMVDSELADYGSPLRDEAAIPPLLIEGKASAETIAAATATLVRNRSAAGSVSEQERAWLLVAARALGNGPVKLSVGDAAVDQPSALYRSLSGGALTAALTTTAETPQTVAWTAVGLSADAAAPASNGMAVRRRVFDMNGAEVDPAKAVRNASYVVVLEGEVTDGVARTHALLTDAVPGGAEIETVRHGGTGALGGLAWLGDLSPARWHRIRESRLDMVIELSAAAPKFRIAYVVRAVAAGRYAVPGSRLVDLDRPGRSAMGIATTVTIADE